MPDAPASIPPEKGDPPRSPPADSIVRGSTWTLGIQFARFVVNIVATMVLARFLTPDDFGLYAMVMAIVGLLFMFRDGGVESALLQKDQVSSAELAALNSFNVLLGVAFALLVLGLGPVLAAIYHEPRITGACAAAAACFLVYGFDVQPAALLLRAQRFVTHSIIEFCGLLAGLGVAVILAINDQGYWALFALDFTLAATLLAGHIGTASWRPQFAHPLKKIRGMLSFGGTVSVVRLLGHASRNIDQIIIGWALGPAALGFYAKSIRLINMPHEAVNWPLTRIAVPTLSRLREKPVEYRKLFQHLTGISATLGLPIVVWIGLAADDIVATLYGDQWNAAVPLVQIMAILGGFNTIMAGTSWVYLSTNAVKRQIPWETLTFLLLLGSLLWSVQTGLTRATITATTACTILRIGAWIYSLRPSPISIGNLCSAIWRPVFAAVVTSGITLWAITSWDLLLPAPVAAAVWAAVVGFVYAGVWFILPQGRQILISYCRESRAVIS